MKKLTLFFLVLLVVILGSLVTLFFFAQSKVLQVTTYTADLTVSSDDIIGINVDPDGLHFGSLGPGAGARKVLYINKVQEDVLVKIHKKGSISPFLSYPEAFNLEKGEDRNVTFIAAIPSNAEFGDYEGTVIIELLRR